MRSIDDAVDTGMFSVDRESSVSSAMFSAKDHLTAQEFTQAINSGKMSIEDAYTKFWTYEEDMQLWQIRDKKTARAILPEWRGLVLSIGAQLEEKYAIELEERIAAPYFENNHHLQGQAYNPFCKELFFAASVHGKSASLKGKKSQVIDELYRLVQRKDDNSLLKEDALGAIASSGEFREMMLGLINGPDRNVNGHVVKTCLLLGEYERIKDIILNHTEYIPDLENSIVTILSLREIEKLMVSWPESREVIRNNMFGVMAEEKVYSEVPMRFIRDKSGDLNYSVMYYYASFGKILPEIKEELNQNDSKRWYDLINFLNNNKVQDEAYDKRIEEIFESALLSIEGSDEDSILMHYEFIAGAAAAYLSSRGIFNKGFIRYAKEDIRHSTTQLMERCCEALARTGKIECLNDIYFRTESIPEKTRVIRALEYYKGKNRSVETMCWDAGRYPLSHLTIYAEEILRKRYNVKEENREDNESEKTPEEDLICILDERPVDSHAKATEKVKIIDFRLEHKADLSTRLVRAVLQALTPMPGDSWMIYRDVGRYHRYMQYHEMLRPQGHLATRYDN